MHEVGTYVVYILWIGRLLINFPATEFWHGVPSVCLLCKQVVLLLRFVMASTIVIKLNLIGYLSIK